MGDKLVHLSAEAVAGIELQPRELLQKNG